MTTAPPSSGSGAISSSTIHNDPSRYDDRARSVSTLAWSGYGTQWSAIAAGAIAGFAIAVLMATLGTALGLTASAAAIPEANASGVSAYDAQNIAATFGIGVGIWMLLTAVAVGITGGAVLAKTAQWERPYSPCVLGLVTWGLGISLATLLAVSGTGALTTVLGAGSAGAAIANADNAGNAFGTTADGERTAPSNGGTTTQPNTESSARTVQLTPEQRAAAVKASEAAATAASTAAWFTLFALLIGLGSTVWAAGFDQFRPDRSKVVPQQA